MKRTITIICLVAFTCYVASAILSAQTRTQLRRAGKNVTGWSIQSTRDADFKSVVALPAGGTTPAGDQWTEDQVYAVVNRYFESGVDIPEVLGDYPTLRATTNQADPSLTHTTAISNVTQLQAMENDLAGNYYLTQNIDASVTSGWDGGAGFDPIDTFTGTFDGNGFTISDLFINRPVNQKNGLFGRVDGPAKIANITLSNVDIAGDDYCGALIGEIRSSTGNNVIVQNCHSSGTIKHDSGLQDTWYGGLIGGINVNSATGTCFIYDCSSSVFVDLTAGSSGGKECGGLIGRASRSTIGNCFATGNVTNPADVGSRMAGFIGRTQMGTVIADCYATGTIMAYLETGGFAGEITDDTTIDRCYATGTVLGATEQEAGGFVGEVVGAMCAITDCYAWVDVTGDQDIGGFVGSATTGSATYDNCYSIGTATGNTTVGGFAGSGDGVGTAVYWDTETSGNATSDGDLEEVGHTTTWLKTNPNYPVSWDFDTIWYQEYTAATTGAGYRMCIEQFTPVDWGSDDDYCWFMDGGPGGAPIGTGWIPSTSSQAPQGTGTWREWICGRGATGFEAWTHEYVYIEGVDSPPYNLTYHVHQDTEGYIYSGSGQDGSGDVKPYKFNSDLSLVSGWPLYDTWESGASQTVLSVRPTNDAQFVYVVSSRGIFANNFHITKLTAETGALVWRKNGQLKPFDAGVLSNGNVIVPNVGTSPAGYYRPEIWDASDGSVVLTYMSQNSLTSHYRILVVETDDVDMWYTVGVATGGVSGYGIAQGWSTTSDSGWDFDPFSSTGVGRCVAYKNNAVYVGTNRLTYNGNLRSMFKLDLYSGSVLDSWDLGFTPQDIAINYLNQFVVVKGSSDPMWYIYDDDFNELATYNRNSASTWRIEQIPDAIQYGGVTFPEAGPGDANSYYGLDHMVVTDVCVYADGNSIGNFTVDVNGVIDLGASYDVVIAGINYWSKLETVPLRVGSRLSDKKLSAIRFDLDKAFYLQYAMGANSTPIVCDFNEVITSSIKYEKVSFPFGSLQKPTIFIQTDEPVPLGLRAIIPEVTLYNR